MKMPVLRIWAAALAASLLTCLLPAQTPPFRDGDRVMFLGDSITHGGWYIAQLQYIWALRHPGMRVTLLNGGICGHTAKDGLARFDWGIAPQKPNRVFIMFGMNDVGHGAYWDPAKADAKSLATRKEKVASFTANMRALIAKCRGIGASVTLMTPTPYDEYSTLVEKKALPGVQVVRRGGDINDEKSTFEKLDQWIAELRVANQAGGHYYRYYGGEVKRFKELYPKRESELKRLETVREELFAHCRPQSYELSLEPVP